MAASRRNLRQRIGPRTGVLLVLFALVLLELAARAAGFGAGVAVGSHPTRGWAPLPNQDAVEAGYSVQINALGCYDESWGAAPKASGVRDGALRIAVLGSSLTVGPGVPTETRWTEVLQQQSGSPVRNFAQSGYGLEQMAVVFREEIRAWQPDVLVVEVHDGAAIPMLRPVGDGPLRRIALRSALYDAWCRLVTDHRGLRPAPPRSAAERGERAEIERMRTRPFADEDLARWDQAQAVLRELAQAQTSWGGTLIALAAPQRTTWSEPDAPRAATWLSGWAGTAQLRVVDPTEALDNAAGGDPAALFLDADPQHWSPLTHRALAQEMGRALSSLR